MERPRQTNLKPAARYFKLFVNRLAYTVQSPKPDRNGKHYYYRSKDGRRLSLETIPRHLNGRVDYGPLCAQPEDAALQVGRH